jgi:hypothetical protein
MIVIKPHDPAELEKLMTADQYLKVIGGETG